MNVTSVSEVTGFTLSVEGQLKSFYSIPLLSHQKPIMSRSYSLLAA